MIAPSGSGTVTLTGTSAARGTLESGQISVGNGLGLLVIDGGILRAIADTPAFLSHFNNADLAINGDGVTIDTYNHNIGIPVPLQGTGGLTKVGAGTLDLTGIDHYQGVTTVNAGKLLVNGMLTGEVVVNAGGTLGGNGSSGKVTVNPGGILAPGNSPGKLTVNGDYLQAPAGVVNIELGGTNPGVTYDQLVVTGAASLGGVLNLTLVNGFQPSVGDTFKILDCQSISGSFARIVGSGFGVSQSQSGGAIVITVTSVRAGVPAITSPLALTTTAGNRFVYQVTATGTPSAFNAADLPTGLMIDPATGIISGTPAASGSFAIILSASNATGAGSAVLSLTVGPAVNSLANISTRLQVGTGDNVAIAGFIVGGSEPKSAVIRAVGPTLAQFGVRGALQNPKLDLYDSAGALISTNDNWADATDTTAVSATQLVPVNPAEPAIAASLAPGSYTAIASGVGSTTGVGLIEVYDVSPASNSRLNNISTRGFVQTEENVMIAGVIVKAQSQTVLIRGLGPSLTKFGVPNALQNPYLDLRDANGNQLAANDNWKDVQRAAIQATGLAPLLESEASIFTTLSPGNYTAILSGVDQTTGNALVEVYALD